MRPFGEAQSKAMRAYTQSGQYHTIMESGVRLTCITFHQEISAIEEELKLKDDIIKKQERLIEGWKKDLKDQLDKHNNELEKV